MNHTLRILTLSILMAFFTSGILQAQCIVEPYFSPYDDVERVVIQRLSDAKQSIQCSLYGITNRKITDTLKQKMASGVDVNLCLDKLQSAGKHSTHQELKDAGADVVIKKTSVLEHNKFCVIDGTRVVMGSWNYSGNAQSQDNSMVDLSGCQDVIKQFETAFKRIYERDR